MSEILSEDDVRVMLCNPRLDSPAEWHLISEALLAHNTALLARVAELERILAELVWSCSPPRLPTDDAWHGAQAPQKEILEAARTALARKEDAERTPTHGKEG